MAKVKKTQLKQIIEAAIFVADKPLSPAHLQETVLSDFELSKKYLTQLLNELQKDYANKGVHLVKLASGYRFQSDASLNAWVGRLWQEQTPRYSRALLETLSLIAYRQPITRGEIEQVRGVSVSSHIIKTLQERDWIKVVGHKEVPGRPALYATTNGFLDYFGIQALADLPAIELPEQQNVQDLDEQGKQPLFPDEPPQDKTPANS